MISLSPRIQRPITTCAPRKLGRAESIAGSTHASSQGTKGSALLSCKVIGRFVTLGATLRRTSQNSLGNFAGIVAPAATGFIIDSTHHFTAAFLLAAAVSMLGLIGWLWMLPKLGELQWEEESTPPAAAGALPVSSA